MLFDPAVVAKFTDCGVSILDAPSEVIGTVLLYLGKDPNSKSPEDLKAAEKVLLAIRPYVRYVHSSRYIDDLANGEICLALGWSGDVKQAHDRAKEAGKGIDIAYSHPARRAPSSTSTCSPSRRMRRTRSNAHLFINYLLRPEVAAQELQPHQVRQRRYCRDIQPLDPAVRNDPGVYPPPEVRERSCVPERPRPAEYQRLLTRMWTRFKTGK